MWKEDWLIGKNNWTKRTWPNHEINGATAYLTAVQFFTWLNIVILHRKCRETKLTTIAMRSYDQRQMVKIIERNCQPAYRVIGFGAPMLHIIQRKQLWFEKGLTCRFKQPFFGLSCTLSRLIAFTFSLPIFLPTTPGDASEFQIEILWKLYFFPTFSPFFSLQTNEMAKTTPFSPFMWSLPQSKNSILPDNVSSCLDEPNHFQFWLVKNNRTANVLIACCFACQTCCPS